MVPDDRTYRARKINSCARFPRSMHMSSHAFTRRQRISHLPSNRPIQSRSLRIRRITCTFSLSLRILAWLGLRLFGLRGRTFFIKRRTYFSARMREKMPTRASRRERTSLVPVRGRNPRRRMLISYSPRYLAHCQGVDHSNPARCLQSALSRKRLKRGLVCGRKLFPPLAHDLSLFILAYIFRSYL